MLPVITGYKVRGYVTRKFRVIFLLPGPPHLHPSPLFHSAGPLLSLPQPDTPTADRSPNTKHPHSRTNTRRPCHLPLPGDLWGPHSRLTTSNLKIVSQSRIATWHKAYWYQVRRDNKQTAAAAVKQTHNTARTSRELLQMNNKQGYDTPGMGRFRPRLVAVITGNGYIKS